MKLIKFCIYSISRIFLLSIVLVSCNNQSKPTKAIITPAKLIQYVDPMIGTDKMGHTYPGATVPFGSIQLSPDTDTIPYAVDGKYNPEVYKYCAGYQYDDTTIVGFSHTHFSGTGHSDLGDFLLMPTTGSLKLNPGTESNPEMGYRSRFSHKTEKAEPAYYKVDLDDYNIKAELTATTRVGMHRYTFPKTKESHLILDLMSGIYNYDEKNVWTFVRVENDTLVTGYRQTNGWARTRTVYFAMSFSQPITQYGHAKYDKTPYKGFWRKFDESKNFPEMAGEKVRAYFDFETKEDKPLLIKFSISPVSTQGALKNMQAEIPHWDFDCIKKEGQEKWNTELSKVQIVASEDTKVNFYTSMYHAFLGPTEYMDVDQQYRGLDMNVHSANGFTNYTSFSLWDTYRALHPLFNILQPDRNRDMIQSMMAHYYQSVHHMLPIWSHYANENWCMIGYHSVSVIADAIVKEILTGKEAHEALAACVQTAQTKYYDGLGNYMDLGYVPEDLNGSSVSKTLEYSYDDWAISQAAKKLGNMEIYNMFKQRAENYKNVYDSTSGFMRPRLSNGEFKEKFDPLDTHGQGFIEGNAWNYSLYVPHHPKKLIELMGGEERFVSRLDSLFSMELPDKYFEKTEDISREGIIGNYVHGNEPSHHVLYLYNWTHQAFKSHDKIRKVLTEMYKSTPDGLGGNDDFGQMSAWYIFSSLGFYPVAPGSTTYAIGSPSIEVAQSN